MLAKLVVEGKEFDIEILDPKLQELITPKKKTGYEPVDKNEYYWIVNEESKLRYVQECSDDEDALFYSTANYYESELVAAQNARADTLMRQLRRFAVEHRNGELDYDCGVYTIHWNGKFVTTIRQYGRDFGHILFDSGQTCNLAIETFHDELIWYFTEYRDSL